MASTETEQKVRCQSCGMPLQVVREGKLIEGFYGTNPDGSENKEWCKFCFQKGAFTRPELTLDEMIRMSIDNMVNEVKLPPEKAVELANTVIPNLRRWRR